MITAAACVHSRRTVGQLLVSLSLVALLIDGHSSLLSSSSFSFQFLWVAAFHSSSAPLLSKLRIVSHNYNSSPSWSKLSSAVAPPAPTGRSDTTTTDAKSRDQSSSSSSSYNVRIHGQWYDLTRWRRAHPGGSHWIDYYQNRDATEVMDAFHSTKGRSMYQRLPKTSAADVPELEARVPPDTSTQLAFRQLRSELEQDGWWERDMVHEVTQLSLWATCGGLAVATVSAAPAVSIMALALSMTAAGWLGHDYIHGVDAFANRMRIIFGAMAGGFCPTWWSDKHNKHHALTNEQGVDEDLCTNPLLYTWAPDPIQDSPIRKLQHFTFWIPFSFLFALWRFDSVKVAIQSVRQKRPQAKFELAALVGHYAILWTLFPMKIWFPAVFVSGLMSAIIVTTTHQSEDLFDTYQSDWVQAQFRSTRNAVLSNPFSSWLWGGMQYQLEHHLFPTMPRHRYPLLRPKLMQFARDHGLEYRESGEWEILWRNWKLYRQVAQAPSLQGAPLTTGQPGQQAAIDAPPATATRTPRSLSSQKMK
ncbi:hypothetical protein ACA910_018259 [Epithemia clementina (nom. ined.)]